MSLDPRILAEKLCPPRALEAVAGALYAPPLPPSRLAWLAWLDLDGGAGHATQTLDAVVARARQDGATALVAGGPPGNYVLSGIDTADTAACGYYTAAGFAVHGTTHDLCVAVTPGAPREGIERVVRAQGDAVLHWIRGQFAPAWAMEATRALDHDGLFVARTDEGTLMGFAAHSGNNVPWGTFGPIGVDPAWQGRGLGRRLTATALDDLGTRGFSTVTVPWVALETVPFYQGLARVIRHTPRVQYRLALTRP